MKKTALQMGRRRFIRAVPAAVAATVALPAAGRAQRGGGAPAKFGKDVLKCAEQIDGLPFTDAEEELARRRRQPQPRQLRGAAQARHPARYRAGDHLPAVPAGQASGAATRRATRS